MNISRRSKKYTKERKIFMKLNNLRLTLANIARTSSAKTLSVNSAGITYKKNSDGTPSSEIDHCFINCLANRGDTIKVKFPVILSDRIEQLKTDLNNGANIEISFTNLKIIPYALKGNDGSVISGVTCKADDYTIITKDFDDVLTDIDI